MRYLDANVFIYAALYSGEKGDNARKILMELPYSEKSITSALTLDEVVWVIWKETDRKTGILGGKNMMRMTNLDILPVEPKDINLAFNLMEQYEKLKPRDAIHLGVALNSGAKTIISDDSDFDEIKEIEREKLIL